MTWGMTAVAGATLVGGMMSGGSGGGGGQVQTGQQVTQTDVPQYVRPYVESMLGRTAALTDINQNPYQSYGNQRVAGFTPMQIDAFNRAANQQVARQIGQATNIAGQISPLAFQYGGQGVNAAQQGFGAGAEYQRAATSPGDIQAYMSPYMQNVVDYQKEQAIRDFQKQAPMMQAQAVGQGAFGGNRLALQQAEANRALQNQLAGIQATGTQSAFDKAQQAQQFRANLGLQGLQAGYQGLGLGLQGLGAAGQAASTLGALGQTQFGQETSITDAIARAGALQQAQQQRLLDTQYQDFLESRNYPYKQLAFQSDMLRGLPLSQSSQSIYQAPPSMMSQVAGLGATGLGLYGLMKKKGGAIKAKKEGSDLADLRLHKLVG